jgi:hypothetical protein
MEDQPESKARLDGDRRVDRFTTRLPVAGACHAAMASSVTKTVSLPRLTSAASYAGQFVIWNLTVGILWRRL